MIGFSPKFKLVEAYILALAASAGSAIRLSSREWLGVT